MKHGFHAPAIQQIAAGCMLVLFYFQKKEEEAGASII